MHATRDRMRFGLSTEIIASLQAVIAKFAEVQTALVFGSRARGNFRDSSDIDIAIVAPSLGGERFDLLWSELDDLPLAFKLDVLHVDAIDNEDLKRKIFRDGIPL